MMLLMMLWLLLMMMPCLGERCRQHKRKRPALPLSCYGMPGVVGDRLVLGLAKLLFSAAFPQLCSEMSRMNASKDKPKPCLARPVPPGGHSEVGLEWGREDNWLADRGDTKGFAARRRRGAGSGNSPLSSSAIPWTCTKTSAHMWLKFFLPWLMLALAMWVINLWQKCLPKLWPWQACVVRSAKEGAVNKVTGLWREDA